MSGRTHALVPAAFASVLFHADPLLLLTAALGGLVPDIDEPDSVIGQRLWMLSWWMKYLVGHRTLSHSLLMVIGVGVMGLVLLVPPNLVMAFCLGWGSHLILDGLSGGIFLWWPSKQRWVLGRHPVFGPLDRILLVSGMVVCVLCIAGRVHEEVRHPWTRGVVHASQEDRCISCGSLVRTEEVGEDALRVVMEDR